MLHNTTENQHRERSELEKKTKDNNGQDPEHTKTIVYFCV